MLGKNWRAVEQDEPLDWVLYEPSCRWKSLTTVRRNRLGVRESGETGAVWQCGHSCSSDSSSKVRIPKENKEFLRPRIKLTSLKNTYSRHRKEIHSKEWRQLPKRGFCKGYTPVHVERLVWALQQQAIPSRMDTFRFSVDDILPWKRPKRFNWIKYNWIYL